MSLHSRNEVNAMRLFGTNSPTIRQSRTIRHPRLKSPTTDRRGIRQSREDRLDPIVLLKTISTTAAILRQFARRSLAGPRQVSDRGEFPLADRSSIGRKNRVPESLPSSQSDRPLEIQQTLAVPYASRPVSSERPKIYQSILEAAHFGRTNPENHGKEQPESPESLRAPSSSQASQIECRLKRWNRSGRHHGFSNPPYSGLRQRAILGWSRAENF